MKKFVQTRVNGALITYFLLTNFKKCLDEYYKLCKLNELLVCVARKKDLEEKVQRGETTCRADWNSVRVVTSDRLERRQDVAALCAYWHDASDDDG